MTYGLLWSTGESWWGWGWWWWRWWYARMLVDNMPGFYWCKRAALHRLIQNPPRFNINHNFSSQSPRSITNSIKMMLQTWTQSFIANYQLENYKSFDQMCKRNSLMVPFLEPYMLTKVFVLKELVSYMTYISKKLIPWWWRAPSFWTLMSHIQNQSVAESDLKLGWVRLWTSN